ncbi:MAG: acyl-CoA synthetase FdrA [Gammaproteobacteria bacterium]|nr:MAG: acyl-CoA synthetase FdrA [Gammaproteobacteria bacterium]
MSATILNEVRKGFYLDSVALMRLSRTLADLEGVEEAALMMGTPANRRIMADAGLLDAAGEAAGGGDLIIGVRAISAAAADSARIEARALLDTPASGGREATRWRPRTLRAALKSHPGANLVVISVAGEFAVAEARKAIRRGLHAMIFSDNVSLAEEAALKREARELGCLVMGPDCGTAIINGIPLAFANRVPRGDIGIIGASGTGTQEISCLIARYGGGISQAIGVGGRDLKTEVGGISTLMALDALATDAATAHIALVSKPPPAEVAARILERIAASGKPATVCFIGAGELPMPANATQAFTLKAAAQTASGVHAEAATEEPIPAINVARGRSRIQGLFSGGTLCAEAQIIFRAADEAVFSNAPVPGVALLAEAHGGHPLLDLGNDEYTQGKPHPMIDPSVRDAAMVAALGDAAIGVILLDVVIGYGAHDDPADHLASVLKAHGVKDGPAIVASVTGTEEDPQIRSVQVAKLEAAGVHVAPTNADAALWALSAIRAKGREG